MIRIIFLSLVTMVVTACGTAETPPPPTKNATGAISQNASLAQGNGAGSNGSGLNPKDPLNAWLDDGKEKTPGQIRARQVSYLTNQVQYLSGLANTYDSQCFKMSTDMLNREISRGILPANTPTLAGSAFAGFGALAIGGLGVGMAGGDMTQIGSIVGQQGGAAGKSFGEGVDAEINKRDIRNGIDHINGMVAGDMETCEATVKNYKAKIRTMMNQINDLNNLGIE
jgi:hypothetical protein